MTDTAPNKASFYNTNVNKKTISNLVKLKFDPSDNKPQEETKKPKGPKWIDSFTPPATLSRSNSANRADVGRSQSPYLSRQASGSTPYYSIPLPGSAAPAATYRSNTPPTANLTPPTAAAAAKASPVTNYSTISNNLPGVGRNGVGLRPSNSLDSKNGDFDYDDGIYNSTRFQFTMKPRAQEVIAHKEETIRKDLTLKRSSSMMPVSRSESSGGEMTVIPDYQPASGSGSGSGSGPPHRAPTFSLDEHSAPATTTTGGGGGGGIAMEQNGIDSNEMLLLDGDPNHVDRINPASAMAAGTARRSSPRGQNLHASSPASSPTAASIAASVHHTAPPLNRSSSHNSSSGSNGHGLGGSGSGHNASWKNYKQSGSIDHTAVPIPPKINPVGQVQASAMPAVTASQSQSHGSSKSSSPAQQRRLEEMMIQVDDADSPPIPAVHQSHSNPENLNLSYSQSHCRPVSLQVTSTTATAAANPNNNNKTMAMTALQQPSPMKKVDEEEDEEKEDDDLVGEVEDDDPMTTTWQSASTRQQQHSGLMTSMSHARESQRLTPTNSISLDHNQTNADKNFVISKLAQDEVAVNLRRMRLQRGAGSQILIAKARQQAAAEEGGQQINYNSRSRSEDCTGPPPGVDQGMLSPSLREVPAELSPAAGLGAASASFVWQQPPAMPGTAEGDEGQEEEEEEEAVHVLVQGEGEEDDEEEVLQTKTTTLHSLSTTHTTTTTASTLHLGSQLEKEESFTLGWLERKASRAILLQRQPSSNNRGRGANKIASAQELQPTEQPATPSRAAAMVVEPLSEQLLSEGYTPLHERQLQRQEEEHKEATPPRALHSKVLSAVRIEQQQVQVQVQPVAVQRPVSLASTQSMQPPPPLPPHKMVVPVRTNSIVDLASSSSGSGGGGYSPDNQRYSLQQRQQTQTQHNLTIRTSSNYSAPSMPMVMSPASSASGGDYSPPPGPSASAYSGGASVGGGRSVMSAGNQQPSLSGNLRPAQQMSMYSNSNQSFYGGASSMPMQQSQPMMMPMQAMQPMSQMVMTPMGPMMMPMQTMPMQAMGMGMPGMGMGMMPNGLPMGATTVMGPNGAPIIYYPVPMALPGSQNSMMTQTNELEYQLAVEQSLRETVSLRSREEEQRRLEIERANEEALLAAIVESTEERNQQQRYLTNQQQHLALRSSYAMSSSTSSYSQQQQMQQSSSSAGPSPTMRYQQQAEAERLLQSRQQQQQQQQEVQRAQSFFRAQQEPLVRQLEKARDDEDRRYDDAHSSAAPGAYAISFTAQASSNATPAQRSILQQNQQGSQQSMTGAGDGSNQSVISNGSGTGRSRYAMNHGSNHGSMNMSSQQQQQYQQQQQQQPYMQHQQQQQANGYY